MSETEGWEMRAEEQAGVKAYNRGEESGCFFRVR